MVNVAIALGTTVEIVETVVTNPNLVASIRSNKNVY